MARSQLRMTETASKGVFATLIPFAFFQLPMIPAILLLEGGAYSSEIGEAGRPIGAIWYFLLYLALALGAFVVVRASLHHRAPPPPPADFVRTANVASILMLLFYLIPVFVYGPAFLIGQTRYQFLAAPFTGLFNIKLYLGIICVFHGWMFSTTKRPFYVVYFVAVLLAMIAWGEKYSGPQYAVTYFVVGLALSGGFVRKVVVPALIILPLVLGIWALPTVLAGRSDELSDAFRDRLARQAQVFYKTIEEPPSGASALALPETLDYFGAYTPQANGMNYLKDQYIAPELKDEHDGSFAAGFPAITLSAGIVPGFLVVFALEILRFILMREILIVGIGVHRLVLWPLYIYLLTYIGKIYESGNTYLLTSPVFFTMVAAVFLLNRVGGRGTELLGGPSTKSSPHQVA